MLRYIWHVNVIYMWYVIYDMTWLYLMHNITFNAQCVKCNLLCRYNIHNNHSGPHPDIIRLACLLIVAVVWLNWNWYEIHPRSPQKPSGYIVTSASFTLPASQPNASLSLHLSSILSKNLTNNGDTPAPTPKPDTWVNPTPKSYPHQGSPSGDKRARA